MKRLFLTDMGIINALGSDPKSILQACLNSDQGGMVHEAGWLVEGDAYVASVKAELPPIPGMNADFKSRNNQLLLLAYQQISVQVNELISRFGADRVAVVLGSSTSGIWETEKALDDYRARGDFPQDYRYVQQEMGSPALFLAEMLGLKNAALTISTACSSSAKAFSTAKNLIDSGFCDAALVGGVDSLCRLTLNGFNALECISSDICRPFSEGRDGITIGEAAALFIVSTQPNIASDTQIELAGVGESSDAYHMSAPQPNGLGAEAAMSAALDMAEIEAANVDYINLHGTATPKNDEMESAAVNRVFGDSVYCSSTKSLTGHTLGAAGATELGICWLLLSLLNEQNRLPAQVWGQTSSEQLDGRLAALKFVAKDCSFNADIHNYMLSNSFAFGGNNVSLIIKRSMNNVS